MSLSSTVFVVDDDEDIRITLARFFAHNNYEVKTFESGDAFLDQVTDACYGCLLLDIAMPGLSGLEVQNELIERKNKIPIIFMTGHADVPTSVLAIKKGAFEFLEKPFDLAELLTKVAQVFEMELLRQVNTTVVERLKQKLETLTKRELDVMQELVSGVADMSNKDVASKIGISHRTVEEYRSRIMHKMEASSITHLVEMAKICGIYRK